MTPDQTTLARTLAERPRFRENAGLLPVGVDRSLDGMRAFLTDDGVPVPDLTDAATGGVLLAMVLEQIPGAWVAMAAEGAEVRWTARKGKPPRTYHQPHQIKAPAVAEVCARALLAHWGPA